MWQAIYYCYLQTIVYTKCDLIIGTAQIKSKPFLNFHLLLGTISTVSLKSIQILNSFSFFLLPLHFFPSKQQQKSASILEFQLDYILLQISKFESFSAFFVLFKVHIYILIHQFLLFYVSWFWFIPWKQWINCISSKFIVFKHDLSFQLLGFF
jgi:hypothetical protein